MASFGKGMRGGQHLSKKDHDAARKAEQLKELEQGFNIHFVSTSKPQPKRNAKQPSWLADKIRRACAAEADGESTEPLWKLLDREMPLDSKPKYSPKLGEEVEVRDKDMPEWRVGIVTATVPLKVRLMDWEEEFQWDHVRRRVPDPCESKQVPAQPSPGPPRPEKCPLNRMQAPDDTPAPPFAGIRPEQQCTCGNRFQREALFCCRCGRQRGCEPNIPPTAGKPPRPPVPPARPKNVEPSGIRKSGTSPRMRSVVPVSSGGGAQVVNTTHMEAEITAKLPAICHACGGGHASQDCPQTFSFQMEVCGESLKTSLPSRPGSACSRGNSIKGRSLPKQNWQQLTVPILAENGEVVALRPADESNQGVWQQNTVPILGENGEVIALRAAPGPGGSPAREWKQSTVHLPVFDEQGDLVAVQNRGECKWQQETVPVLGENGEVIALRPAASGPSMWTQKSVPIFGASGQVIAVCPAIGNLQQWEQLTVPLLAEDGNIVGLRPAGDRYEMPGWAPRGPPSPAPKAKARQVMATAGTTIGSDRTFVPGKPLPPKPKSGGDDELQVKPRSNQDSPRLSTSLWAERAGRVRRDSEPNVGSLSIESISNATNPAEKGRRLRRGSDSELIMDSLKVESICSTLNTPERARGSHLGGEERKSNDSLKADSISMPPISGASSLNPSRSQTPDILINNQRHGKPPEKLSVPGNSSPDVNAGRACKPKKELLLSPTVLSPSPSACSMASLDEILRMCNDARMATPDGHMLDVLRDALGPQDATGTVGNSSLGQLGSIPQAPEADELVLRLKQLPDLWRSTILSMLEQAEACQLPSGK